MRSSTSTLIYIVSILPITVLGLPANKPSTPVNATSLESSSFPSLESSVNAFVTCWDVSKEHKAINERLCENTFRFLLSSPRASEIITYTAERRVFGAGPCGIVLDYNPGTHPSIALSLVDIVVQSQRILGNCARSGGGGSMQFEQEGRYHLGVGQNLLAKPPLAGSAHDPNGGTA